MNHTYRVIYNESTNTFVAVSEIVSAKGKKSKGKKSAKNASSALVAVGVAAAGVSGTLMTATEAEAAVLQITGTGNQMAIGVNNSADNRASATGDEALAVGQGASASGNYATSFGRAAAASGVLSTSLGHRANTPTNGYGDVAIGAFAKTENRDGQARQDSAAGNSPSVAIGFRANATGVLGDTIIGAFSNNAVIKGQSISQSTIVGSRSVVGGDQSVAVGSDVRSMGNTSVAIGGDDVSRAAAKFEAAGVRTFDGLNSQRLTDKGISEEKKTVLRREATGELTVSGTQRGEVYGMGHTNHPVGGTFLPTAAIGDGSVSIGALSQSIGTASVSLGVNAISEGELSSAVGTASRAYGLRGVAMGAKATAGEIKGSVAEAAAAGADTIAIGTNARAINAQAIAMGLDTTVSGVDSAAFGRGNTVAQDNTFVMGKSVTTTQANSVVLGNASTDRAATTEATATVNGIRYGNFAGQGSAAKGVVSVGSVGNERQVINVAAGNVSATSTDAINGSQLYLVANELSTRIANGGGATTAPQNYFHVNTATVVGGPTRQDNTIADRGNMGTGDAATNLGAVDSASGATKVGSLAAGVNAVARGNWDVAIGTNAQTNLRGGLERTDNPADRTASVAIGHRARAHGSLGDTIVGSYATNHRVTDRFISQSTIVGSRTAVGGDQAIAIGADTRTYGNSALAMGGDDVRLAATALKAAGVGTFDGINLTASRAEGGAAIPTGHVPFFQSYSQDFGGAYTYDKTATAVDSGNGVNIPTTAIGDASIAIAPLAISVGTASTAIGVNAITKGDLAQAVGTASRAHGLRSNAVGVKAQAMNADSIAFGTNSRSDAKEVVAKEDALARLNGLTTLDPAAAETETLLNNIRADLKQGFSAGTVDTVMNATKARMASQNGVTALAMLRGVINGQSFESTATYTNSTAIGTEAAALHNHAIAIGTNATSNALGSIAIGTNVRFNGNNTGAITVNEKYEDGDAPFVVIGHNSSTQSRFGDTVVGSWAKSENPDFSINQATVIGSRAIVYGDQGVALGADTRALGNSSVAIGGDDLDKAAGKLATLLGVTDLSSTTTPTAADITKVTKVYETFKAEAGTVGKYIAGPVELNADGTNTATVGRQYPNTAAIGDASLAIGTGSQTLGVASNAIGANALAKGLSSTAVGTLSRAWGESSIAMGTQANASTLNSIVLGHDAKASARTGLTTSSHQIVIGNNAISDTHNQVVMGSNATGGNFIGSVIIGTGAKGHLEGNSNSPHLSYDNPYNSIGKRLTATGQPATFTNGQAYVGRNVTTNNTEQFGSSVTAVGYESEAVAGGTAIGDNARAVRNANGENGRGLGVAVGANAYSRGGGIAVGSSSMTEGINAVAIGRQAVAKTSGAQAIGVSSAAVGNLSLAVGSSTTSTGERSIAIGSSTSNEVYNATESARSEGKGSIALGAKARVGENYQDPARPQQGFLSDTERRTWNQAIEAESNRAGLFTENSISIGTNSTVRSATVARTGNTIDATNNATNSIAVGHNALVTSNSSIAMGHGASATGENSTAIGRDAVASGKNSISVGLGNQVSGANSGAFGDPSVVTGTNSYSIGNNNAIGSKTDNGIALGGQNNLGATATRNGDGVITATTITDDGSASRSMVIGFNNTVKSDDVMVLGNNVSVATGLAGSVILGQDAGTAGSHDIANVTQATVNGVTYGGFAGTVKDAGRFVSVGKAGDERKLINVAAGNISATSTEAINGSQLYQVMVKMPKVVKGDNIDVVESVNATTGQIEYKVSGQPAGQPAEDKNTQASVEAGAGITVTPTDNTNSTKKYTVSANTAVTTGTNPNGTVKVDEGGDNLVNGTTLVNTVNNASFNLTTAGNTTTPTVTGQVKAGSTVTIAGGTAVSVAQEGSTITVNTLYDDKTITTNDNKLTVANTTLTQPNTPPNVVNQITTPTTENTTKFVNAGDLATTLNNLGFNVDSAAAEGGTVSGNAKTAVKTGETVKFVAGKDIDIKQDGQNFTISAKTPEVANTTLTVSTGPTEDNKNTPAGKIEAPTEGDKLVNATTVANAINSASWTAKRGESVDTNEDKGNGDSKIAAGDSVTFVAGKNMALQKDGEKFIYATKDDVTFNNVTATNITVPTTPAQPGTDAKPVTINANGISAGDKPITNVSSALTNYADAPRTTLANLSTAPATNAATVGDLQRMGWIVSSDKTTGDLTNKFENAVTNAKEVKFIGTGAATVSGKLDGETNTITVHVDEADAGLTAGNIYVNDGTDQNNSDPSKPVGTVSPDTKTGTAATVEDVANAVNNSGFTVTGNGENTTLVNAGDKVDFTNGTGTTASVTTTGNVTTVKFDVNTATKPNINDKGSVDVPDTNGGDFVNATTLAETINGVSWTAKRGESVDTNEDKGNGDSKIAAGDNVTFIAGKNMALQKDGEKFIYATKDDVTFNNVTATNITVPTTPAQPGTDAKPVTINANGISAGDKPITNVSSALTNYADAPRTTLANLSTAPATNAATVGDLQRMGWIVSSDKTTGDLTNKFENAVTNAKEVKFIGTGAATVSGKLDGETNTITVHVDEADAGLTAGNIYVNDGTDQNNSDPSKPVGTVSPDTKTGTAATVEDVANAVNNSGFTVTGNGENTTLVNAGDKVDFTNGTGTTASVITTGNVTTVKFDVNTATKPNINDKGSVDVPDTNGGDFVNATTLAETINGVSWTAKRGESVDTNEDKGDADSKIAAGDNVTFIAGKNMALQKDGEKFIYATKDDVTFSNVTATNITVPTTPAQPGTEAKPVTINANGISAGDKPITNVSSALTNYADAPRTTLANLSTAPETNAATVGDLQRMGWIVSSDKTTGDLTNKFENAVTNAKEVKFIGTGAATVSGKLDGETNTITVHVDEADAGLTAGNIYVNDGTANNNSDPSKPVGTVSPDITKGTAATVEDVANAVNNSGFTVTGNGENTTLVNAGDKVDFTNGTGTTASVITTGNVTTVKFDVNTATKPNINDKGSVDVPDTNGGDFVNATTLAETINGVSWTAKRGESVDTNEDKGDADSKIAAGDNVTFIAGKNMALQKDGEKFIYATKDDVTFSNVTATNITVPTTPAQPGTEAKPVTINANGISAGDKPITNVSSALTNYADAPRTTLANLSTAPETNAATVGDLQRMGWIVSSDKTTGNLGSKFENAVTNAKEVKFVGTGAATVSGKLDGETNTITVHVDEADAGLTAGNIYVNDGTANNNSDPSKPVGTVSPDITKGTAATVEDVANAVNNSGFTVTGNGENTTLVNAGDKVDFTNGTGTTASVITTGNVTTVKFDVNTATKPNINDKGSVDVPDTNGGDFVNATTLAETINGVSWTAKRGESVDTNEDKGDADSKIAAGDNVTFIAGKNMALQKDGEKFIYATKDDVTFSNVTATNITVPTTPAQPGTEAKPVTINANGISAGDKPITNVSSALTNYADAPRTTLANLSTAPETNAATVGDLQRMGWIVSSDKTTGNLGSKFENAVTNAKEVKFVGTGAATVSGKLDGETNTITVHVDEADAGLTAGNIYVNDGTANNNSDPSKPVGTVSPDITKGTAATVEDVANAVNNSGFTVTGNGENTTLVNAGDKVDFTNGTGTTASVITTGNVTTVKFDVNTATKPNINDKGSVDVPDTNGGDFVNATTLAETINGVSWTAKRGESVDTNEDKGDADSKIAAGDNVTFIAGKNMALQKDGEKFIYATKDDVTFSNVTATNITVPTTPAQPGTEAKPVTINANGISAGDKPITNVSSALTNYADAPRTTLANLSTAPETNAATVGDLQRMGWIVSSDKTTGNLGSKFENAVTNAKEVKFVGTGAATVSGKLDGETNTITVHVDEADAGLTAGNIYVNDGTANNNSDPSKPVGTVSPDITKGTAATVEDVANAVNNSGFTVTGNGENTTLVNAGDKVDFTNGTGTTASVITTGNVTTVKFDVNTATKPNINDKGSVDVPDTNGGDFVNATTLAETINGVSWTAKRGESVDTNEDKGDADSKIAAGDNVTFIAGKNMALQKDGEKFIYATKDDVTFSNVTATNITVPTTPAQPGTEAKPVTINANGISAGDKPITNVSSALTNYADAPRTTLANLSTAPETNAATVGDLQRMGWIVSSDKTTGNLGSKFENAVTNAKEVKFVGTGAATVSGKLDGETNTITVHVDEADAGLTAGNIYVNDGTANNNSDPSKPVGTVSPDITKGTAATVEDVANAVNNSGFTVTGNGENTTLVNAGDKVDFTNGTGTTASVITTGNVTTVKFDVNTATKPNINDKGSVDVPDTNGGDFVNATTLAETINGVSWTAKRGESVDTNEDKGDADSKIAAGDNVTFIAGKNMALQKDGEKFIYATKDDVTFSNVTATNITVPTTPAQPGTEAKPVTINANGISAGDKPITNVSSALTNYADAPRTTLANLSTAPETNAATVGDLQRMGWIVSSDKTTGNLGSKFENAVTNAKEVKFVGTGAATVSGKLDGETNTITVHVDEADAGLTAGNIYVNDGTANNNSDPSKPVGTVSPDITKGTAATVEDVANAVNNSGFTVTGNGENTTLVNAGDKVDFTNGTGTTASVITTGNVTTVKFDVNTATKPNINDKGSVDVPDTNGGDFVNATTLAETINGVSWTAKRGESVDTNEDKGDADSKIAAGDNVTFIAGKNMALQKDGEKFIYATKDDVTFSNVTATNITVPTTPAQPGTEAKPVTINANGISAGDKPITNVSSALTNYADAPRTTLANLSTAPETNAATVGDLQRMGWIVSSDKTTGNLGSKFENAVTNAKEVKFVGTGAATVSGKLDGETNTITVHVDEADAGLTAGNIYVNDGTANNNSDPSKPVGTVSPDITKGTAATVEDVANAVNNSGFTVTGNGENTTLVNAGDKVDFTNGTGTTASVITTGNVTTVKFDVNTATKPNINDKGSVDVPDTNGGDFVNATTLAETINGVSWTAKRGESVDTNEDKGDADSKIAAGDNVTFIAGKNMALQKDGEKFIYATKDDVTFSNVNTTTLSVGNTSQPGAPVVNFVAEAAKPATNNAEAPTTALNITSADGKPTQITGVGSSLNKQDIATNPYTGGQSTPSTATLVNLTESGINPNAVATVGDLQNMGWTVSAGNGYKDAVKNADEVKFVGAGSATVSGTTADGVRTITIDVKAPEAAQLPVVYTNKEGDKIVKVGDDYYKAGDVENGAPKPGVEKVEPQNIIASMNDINNDSKTPTTLTNVLGNLAPAYNVDSLTEGSNKKLTDTPATTEQVTKSADAPTGTDLKNIYNNAATVGDVLNAGFNLQENGTAKDFVKAYDTVNFVNGTGTTAAVEVVEGGKVANVTFNVNKAEVTLPTAGTPTPADDNKVTFNEAGKVVAPQNATVAGNTFLTTGDVANVVNNSGWTTTTTGANPEGVVINPGDTVNYVNGTGTTASVVKNDKGGVDVTYNLNTTNTSTINVTRNPDNSVKFDANTTTATATDGKVAPVGNTGDNLMNATEITNAVNMAGWTANVAKTGTGTMEDKGGDKLVNPGDSVTLTAGDNIKLVKDGLNYTVATNENVTFNNVNTTTLSVGNTSQPGAPVVNFVAEAPKPATNNAEAPTTTLNITSADGKPTQITGVGSSLNTTNVPTMPKGDGVVTPVAEQPKLVDLTATNVNPNAVATVGDLQNMGWTVSAGDNYKDAVKNANEVKFVAGSGITVTGETKDNIREIKIETNAQSLTNNSQLPVVYTLADGTKVYKNPNPTAADGSDAFTTEPDGKGTPHKAGDVIASMNNADNTTATPTQLANVKGNLAPTYNTGDYNVVDHKPTDDKAAAPTTGAGTEAAPTIVKAPTPDEVKAMYNNAATVGDVLNAGFNLQENGEAKDFVKAYDTVNFVNGTGTTAVVAMSDDGKVANVTFNSALAYTDNNGNTVDGNGKPMTPTNSVKLVGGDKDAPVTITGATSGLTPTAVPTFPQGQPTTGTPVTPVTANLINFDNNPASRIPDSTVATVGDLRNMGWVVSTSKGNGYSDAVRSSNEVDFVGAMGVTVTGETVNGKRVITISGGNNGGSAVLAGDNVKVDSQSTTNPDGTTSTNYTVSAPTAPITNNANGAVNVPTTAGLANATDVANAINNSGWNLQANGANGTLVNPSDTVSFNNGDNINITKNGNNVTVSTTNDINVRGNLTVAGNTTLGNTEFRPNSVINAGGNQITNVAPGDVTATSTDAINGSQLYQAYQVLGGQNQAIGTTDLTINSGGVTVPVSVEEKPKTDSNGNPVTNPSTGEQETVKVTHTMRTYNVKDQTEYVTNDVIQAISRMNEEGIKFFHTNDENVNKSSVQSSNSVDSSAGGAYATSIGYQAQANGEASVALGKGSMATGNNSIAIGKGNVVRGENSGAIGDPSYIGKTAKGSYTLGNDNSVAQNDTFVLGNNVTSVVENSVFLGNVTGYSAVSEDVKTAHAEVKKAADDLRGALTDYDNARNTLVTTSSEMTSIERLMGHKVAVDGMNKDAAITSIEDESKARLDSRLKSIDASAGTDKQKADARDLANAQHELTLKQISEYKASATSSANVDRLVDLTNAVAAAEKISTEKSDVVDAVSVKVTEALKGETAKLGEYLAVHKQLVDGKKVEELTTAEQQTLKSVSGRTAGTANNLTSQYVAGQDNKFAGGDQVKGVVSVGSDTETRRIQNVAPGLLTENSTDAINGSQLYALASIVNENAARTITVNEDGQQKAVGNTINFVNGTGTVVNVSTTPVFTTKDGEVLTQNVNPTTGAETYTKQDGTVVAEGDVVKTNMPTITYHSGIAFTDKDSGDIVSGLTDTAVIRGDKPVQVSNVASGIAVRNEAGDLVAPTDPMEIHNRVVNAPTEQLNNVATIGDIKGVALGIHNRIDDVVDDANAGISSAMAAASLPQAYLPGKSMLTGGVASYNGQGAVAVGMSKLSDNGRWVLKLHGSADTRGNVGGAVGAGFHF